MSRNRLGRRRPLFLAFGLLLAAAVAVATLSGQGQTGSQTAARVVADRSPLIGRRTPDFAVSGLTRRWIRTADFAGRVLVVNFWASWCVPCRAEAPVLEAASRHWRSHGITVVGIAWHDLTFDANAFRSAHHLSYPQGIDEDEVAGPAYGIVALPATFVIDTHGIVRASVLGQLRRGSLDRAIRRALRG